VNSKGPFCGLKPKGNVKMQKISDLSEQRMTAKKRAGEILARNTRLLRQKLEAIFLGSKDPKKDFFSGRKVKRGTAQLLTVLRMDET
jgi:hypothetical protein